jgi:hypothetical protein
MCRFGGRLVPVLVLGAVLVLVPAGVVAQSSAAGVESAVLTRSMTVRVGPILRLGVVSVEPAPAADTSGAAVLVVLEVSANTAWQVVYGADGSAPPLMALAALAAGGPCWAERVVVRLPAGAAVDRVRLEPVGVLRGVGEAVVHQGAG